MPYKFFRLFLSGFTIVLFMQCMDSTKLQTNVNSNDSSKGLKDYYQKYFPIGVAVSPYALKGDEGNLVLKHFNSLTPENDMKMGPIHPKENEYNWIASDSIMAFAERNNLRVRGHNLCWHNQTPNWIFKDGDKTVSKQVFAATIERIILPQLLIGTKGKFMHGM